MKHLNILLTGFLLLASQSIFAQIYLKLEPESNNTWGVWAIWDSPMIPSTNIFSANSQVTVIIPKDAIINNSITHSGNWDLNSISNPPEEAPDYIYCSWGLIEYTYDIVFNNDEKIKLFSFSIINIGNTLPRLMCNDDPFYPPNSLSINVGNVIYCADFGLSQPGQLVQYTYSGVIGSCSPQTNPTITGNVYKNMDNDCQNTNGEPLLPDWKVKIEGNGFNKTVYSYDDGHFETFADDGTYEISLIPLSNLWEVCPPVSFDVNPSTTIAASLSANPITDCPLLNIEMGVPILRRCSTSVYVFKWHNLGTTVAPSAFATVKFNELQFVKGASVGFQALQDNTFKFNLGDIQANQAGTFTVEVEISCDAIMGQAICTEANIYPNEVCVPGSGIYDGAKIVVDGNCAGQEVAFAIKNIGGTDMAESSSYSVIKDGQQIESGTFQLAAGTEQLFSYPADGATYRLEAAQALEYPIVTFPSSSVEACNANGSTFSTGFIEQFPMADFGPSHAEFCREITGPFDPNDKQGFPVGYGPSHKIEPNTPIEYMIRFQNTGTDTAFQVVIKDTLSSFLDAESIEPGPSSHPYRLTILDGKYLEFNFTDIMLPDSNVNFLASQGFVKYTISQRENISLGSEINNTAAIYFDQNEPIITNTTSHVVGLDFVEISDSKDIKQTGLALKAFPNPTQNGVNFQLSQTDFRVGQLELYNILGQIQRSFSFDGSAFTLERQGLPTGHYFYTITLDGKPAANGKIEFRD